MPDKGCNICGRSLDAGPRPEYHDNGAFTVTFTSEVCVFCIVTLVRAFDGVTDMLKQSHGERRERVIDKLVNRLKSSGFDVGDSFTRRRTA